MVSTDEIAYKNDIIKELSQELGIPEKELAEIVDLNIKYIHKKAKEGDYLIINLPNLCKIRVNLRIAMSSARANGGKERKERAKQRVEKLLEYQKKHRNGIQVSNFQNPLFLRLWKRIKMTKYPPNIYAKMEDMIREVEEKANEIIKMIR